MKFEGAILVALLSSACVWNDIDAHCPINILMNPPNPRLTLEKMDGHWLVFMRVGTLAETKLSDTLDIVSTMEGLTTYSSGFLKPSLSECQYSALEMTNTSQSRVFITKPYLSSRTLVFGDYNPRLQAALLYLCNGHFSGNQICQQATVILAGRSDKNATEAIDWLTALDKYKACTVSSDPIDVIPQDANRVCPLKTTWGLPGRNCSMAKMVVDNFDLSMFMGVWREVAWLVPDYVPQSQIFTDYFHSYSQLENGSISVTHEYRKPSNNKCYTSKTLMTKTDVPGKFIYHEGSGRQIPYNVALVGSGHWYRYALVYGCYNDSGPHGECLHSRGWLWTREYVNFTREMQLKVNSKLQDLCVNPAAMVPTSQHNRCLWFGPTGGAFSPGKGTNMAAALLIASLTFLLRL